SNFRQGAPSDDGLRSRQQSMKTSRPVIAKRSTLLVFTLVLNACGGGGGYGGSSGPPPVTYTVGGTVSGLPSGHSVVLLDNGGDSTTVSSNTTFTFATAIAAGSQYTVTVGTQPTGETCTVTGGMGAI